MVEGRLGPALKWDNEWPGQDGIDAYMPYDSCTIICTCKRFLFSGMTGWAQLVTRQSNDRGRLVTRLPPI